MNKIIYSYIYIDENNLSLIEIEAGIIHDVFNVVVSIFACEEFGNLN